MKGDTEQTQEQSSVESFGWQWTERRVFDTTRTFYRRLFKDAGVWFDHHDGRIVADVCSGNGRHVWALARLTKAAKIISIELSAAAARYQLDHLNDDRIQIIQGDAAEVAFKADFIYLLGAIQHTRDPQRTLDRMVSNLNDGGELLVSFYLLTPSTVLLKPIRCITRRLPKRVLWWISPLLAPLFMVRKAGREMGFRVAWHTAYDWFGSHKYQYYFTKSDILQRFSKAGVHRDNVLEVAKGRYRVRKGGFGPSLSDEVHAFGSHS